MYVEEFEHIEMTIEAQASHNYRLLRLAHVSIAAALMLAACGDGEYAQRDEDPSPHSEATLVLETETVSPGAPFTVGVWFHLEDGWHSYWLNPGDAGQPASIHWELPDGYQAGEVSWPYPTVVEESTVVSYGYFGEFMLLVEMIAAPSAQVGQTVRLGAEVHWLVCSNICLPARADLTLDVDVSDSTPAQDREWRSAFVAARSRIPSEPETWEVAASQDDSTVTLRVAAADALGPGFEGVTFFPSDRRTIAHSAPQVLTLADGVASLALRKSSFLQTPLSRLEGVLVVPGAPDRDRNALAAYAVDVVVADVSGGGN